MEQVHGDDKFSGIRLPDTVKPHHYELHLKPDLENFTFSGQVRVNLQVDAKTNKIVLHAAELEITEGIITAQGQAQPLTRVTYGKETETAALEFRDTVFGEVILSLRFTGILNDKLKGFYRSAFEIDGTTVNIATTQFEAVDARRCFPCWDEPALKATFECSLTIKPTIRVNNRTLEVVALSNTPKASRDPDEDGYERVTFAPTPKMSTYLLAFVVGPFEFIEKNVGSRPVRVYTTPGKKEQGKFALDATCNCLSFYEEYFGIAYPLAKLDVVAVPDFAFGAMENWGLITYRETRLLVDPNNTSADVKQSIALCIAHELAHQWFGNLVTMKWWTHLWLNEGFARFMEHLCVDAVFPEYDIWSSFSGVFQLAQTLDSLHNSHPIEVPISHPSEINTIFDAISYNKGSSIIRMLYNYIGDEPFRAGMKSYLTKFAYKNAVTEDLWDALEESSKKPVREMMSSWTAEKGFPWLSVGYSREGEAVQLTVSQSKFAADGKLPADESETRWVVPIRAIAGAVGPTKLVLQNSLADKQAVFRVEDAGDSWIKLNPGTIDFYITAYPEEMLNKLLPAISSQGLPPMDRLGVQNDLFALCEAGKARTVDLLKLLEAFSNETDFNVWSSLDSCVGRLHSLLNGADYQDRFKAFGRRLYSSIFKKLGWTPSKGESDADAMCRSLVINRLVSLGDEDVVAEALKKFNDHLSTKAVIPADLRSAVYRAAASYGDDEAFEGLFQIYKATDLHEEKLRAAQAMSFAKNKIRVRCFLMFLRLDEVRIQDKYLVFATFGSSSPCDAWKFFQDNKSMIKENYDGMHALGLLIKAATQYFNTEEKADEIEQFFAKNKFLGADRAVQQSLERIRSSASWLSRDGESIKVYLSSCV